MKRLRRLIPRHTPLTFHLLSPSSTPLVTACSLFSWQHIWCLRARYLRVARAIFDGNFQWILHRRPGWSFLVVVVGFLFTIFWFHSFCSGLRLATPIHPSPFFKRKMRTCADVLHVDIQCNAAVRPLLMFFAFKLCLL